MMNFTPPPPPPHLTHNGQCVIGNCNTYHTIHNVPLRIRNRLSFFIRFSQPANFTNLLKNSFHPLLDIHYKLSIMKCSGGAQ